MGHPCFEAVGQNQIVLARYPLQFLNMAIEIIGFFGGHIPRLKTWDTIALSVPSAAWPLVPILDAQRPWYKPQMSWLLYGRELT